MITNNREDPNFDMLATDHKNFIVQDKSKEQENVNI